MVIERPRTGLIEAPFVPNRQGQVARDVEWIRANYGLVVDIRAALDSVDLAVLLNDIPSGEAWRPGFTPTEQATVVRAAREELSKYPSEFTSACGTQKLRFYRGRLSDVHIGYSIRDPFRAIYVAYLSPLQFREIFHHEYFHQSDEDLIASRNSAMRINSLLYQAEIDPVEKRARLAPDIMMGRRNAAVTNPDLRAHFGMLSKGRMGDKYFEDLFAGQVREGYWQNQ